MKRALVALAASLAAGCPGAGPPTPQRPTRAVFLPSGGGFYAQPWPLDTRRTTEGRPALAGLPNPRREPFVERIRRLGEVGPTGFSPSGAIYLPFDGPVAQPAGDPVGATAPGSPVFVVDVDPGSPERLRRHPVLSRVSLRGDGFRPAHLLQLLPVPGRTLRPSTTYAAVVLRSLGSPAGDPLEPAPLLGDLLRSAPPDEPGRPELEALRAAFAPLRAALPVLGLAPEGIAAATVFTTGDPAARLKRQVDHVRVEAPLAPTGPLAPSGAFEAFSVVEGTLDLPLTQDGAAPYLFWGGKQAVDADGLPVTQGAAAARFVLSIPKGPMPAAGYPLLLYCHGTGGRADQAVARGRKTSHDAVPPPGSGLARDAAAVGWGTACVAGPFSPERLGRWAAKGYTAYDVFNPQAMRDNFAQMILEQVRFLSAVLALRLDPIACPGSDASAADDGRIRFDPDRLVVSGQSLGSYLAGMLGALLPDWKGVFLSGAGGSWTEFAFGPRVPFELVRVLEDAALPLGERLDRFHALVMAFDLAVGPADNMHYLRRLVREPWPGHVPPHVLVVEGHDDLQVSTGLQRALALAVGVDLVGDDPGPTPEEQVAPILRLGGLNQRPYPLSGNRPLPAGARRTVAMVRYAEDGIQEGHMVVFQLDAPRRQLREFLAAVAAGEVPVVR